MATRDSISSRERYLTAFGHQEPDRVPILLNIRPIYFVNKRVQWLNQFERAEVLQDLGCDPTINIWLPDPVPHPDVQIKTWREYRKGDPCPYITKEYHTPAGVLRQVVRETADWVSSGHAYWVRRTLGPDGKLTYGMDLFDDWGISRRTEPWIKGPEDIEKLRYIMQMPSGYVLDEWRMDAVRAKEYAERHGLLTVARRTIAYDAALWFCDMTWFMLQLHDDPGFVEEFLDIFRQFALKQEELMLDVGVDVFQYRGWYEAPDLCGPRHFKRFIVPIIQEEAKMAHEADTLFCYLLTKGHTEYVDVLENMDVDIHWGIDPVLGGADMELLKERLGMKTTLLGGVNSEVTLIQGTPEEVAEATRQAISICAPGGGFVLAPIGGVWPEVPWKNVETMIRAAREP